MAPDEVVLPPIPPRAPRAPVDVLLPELAETLITLETFATVLLVTVMLAANKLGAPTRAMVPIRASIFLCVGTFIISFYVLFYRLIIFNFSTTGAMVYPVVCMTYDLANNYRNLIIS
jgi:hypothetical protein